MTAAERTRGFTLLEVLIAMALTLALGAIVYQATSSSWRAYRALGHSTERGFTTVRALEDVALQVARAGYGLSRELEAFEPRQPGLPISDAAITVRSNPSSTPGLEDEVTFWVEEDKTGARVLYKQASRRARQVLARHVRELRFEYLTAEGERIPAILARGDDVAAVRILLELAPEPGAPPVTIWPLSFVVPLESQPRTIVFAFSGPVFDQVGLTGVVGQDPATGRKGVRLSAFKKTLFP